MILFAPLENNIGKIFENFQSINQATVRDKLLMESDVWSLSTPQGSIPDYFYTIKKLTGAPSFRGPKEIFQLNFIYLFHSVLIGDQCPPELPGSCVGEEARTRENCDSDRESLHNTVHHRALSRPGRRQTEFTNRNIQMDME